MNDLKNCPNCAASLNGQYCSYCGQDQKGIDRFFLTLINEAFEDVFRLNSRAWKTLFSLLFKPGFLSKEYCKGRRVSYIRPIKLYFITSILFFVMLSVINFFSEVSTYDSSLNSASSSIEEEQTLETLDDERLVSTDIADDSDPVIDIEISAGDDFESVEEFVDAFSEQTDSNFVKFFGHKFQAVIVQVEEDPTIVRSLLLDFAPPVIFCLLPLFAFLLKLGYLTRRVYYTEHLILALHNHSFLFLILAFKVVIGVVLQKAQLLVSWLDFFIVLYLPVYMWLSLKNVYQQSVGLTSFKFVLLGLSYFSLLIMGIMFCLAFGVMTV